MGIFSKPQPDASGPEPDRLREIAADKIAAAERLSAAIVEMGAATTALLDADRAFWIEWHARHGDYGESTRRLMNQLRPFLLGDIVLNAPAMPNHLNLPRQRGTTGATIASLIARQTNDDLASEAQLKEPAQ